MCSWTVKDARGQHGSLQTMYSSYTNHIGSHWMLPSSWIVTDEHGSLELPKRCRVSLPEPQGHSRKFKNLHGLIRS
ncbi:hypothetical protein DPMN_057447 [Dreissena polymorpha]|uniref:Uncharacterized protein n=1 Tax=Dreissena polymorpha TaxID=45954 RepID=A0A9D4C089_DREPO|nr:hypothetical protein DPMN_057447 [Dreissena polymorpha]